MGTTARNAAIIAPLLVGVGPADADARHLVATGALTLLIRYVRPVVR
jgi:hypothetical protein